MLANWDSDLLPRPGWAIRPHDTVSARPRQVRVYGALKLMIPYWDLKKADKKGLLDVIIACEDPNNSNGHTRDDAEPWEDPKTGGGST